MGAEPHSGRRLRQKVNVLREQWASLENFRLQQRPEGERIFGGMLQSEWPECGDRFVEQIEDIRLDSETFDLGRIEQSRVGERVHIDIDVLAERRFEAGDRWPVRSS